ncbi:acetyltransferase [Novosphingobium piscinae]|uniref:Acetyltransferase n=1 Tax=Novosphingobium piscinae TaxID=1507448 RepID=A0A7X1KNZ1_9SPHN|nr:acetyltransferase [Novosphingobium piscinae]MBC2668142.1 acetyltransferase [Novosphingobium piscinae]
MEHPLSKLARRFRSISDVGLHTFDLPDREDASVEKTITVRLADVEGERNTATALIKRKYSSRGYGAHHKVPNRSNAVTFTASTNGNLIGTLSLTVDSPLGLACDKTFKAELDAYRAVPGAKLCELTRFAFDTSRPSLHLLASLFHIIFIYGTHHYNCTDLFIEVAARHRRFYQAMLGFKPAAEPRVNDAVGVTSHLMVLKVADIRRMIDEHKRDPKAAGHSLYVYFFSRQEELGIYQRLASPLAEPAAHSRWRHGARPSGAAEDPAVPGWRRRRELRRNRPVLHTSPA